MPVVIMENHEDIIPSPDGRLIVEPQGCGRYGATAEIHAMVFEGKPSPMIGAAA